MRLSHDHDPKYLRLGLFLVFTGFLFALIFVTRVNARELSPQIFDTEAVLVYDNDPLSVYGCDYALYFYQDPLNDEILLSSSFNPEIEQLYDHWYGSRVMDSVRSWGFNYLSYDILKGHIINLMSRTNTFWISRYDTISNVELKELVLDDSYDAFYFMDSNFNYYCYVSYIPVNSETVQPEYPFDSFTINDSGHFVEQDPLYRELFVWDLSNQRWIYSSVSSSDVVVHTVLRSPSGVRLESGAQVFVEASRFLIDDPLPTSTPTASPSPTSEPLPATEYRFMYLDGLKYPHLIVFEASNFMEEFSSDTSSVMISGILDEHQSSYPVTFKGCVSYSSKSLFYYFNFGFTASSVSQYKDYKLSQNSSLRDFDLIESTYSYTLRDFSTSDPYPFLFGLEASASTNGGSMFLILDSEFPIDVISSNNVSSENSNYGGTFYSDGYDVKYKSYRIFSGLLDFVSGDVVGPTPTPSPSPSPSPTEPPHVIVNFPTGTPTPTPPFVIPSMPPLNPPGVGITPLDPELQEDVFGVFKSKIGDNNSFGLFGLLIGLLPGDLMWYIWFLLFVLLVVGVAKLIIHFTGG